MKLEFPLTPEKIREGIQKIISSIREETNWDLQRTLSDVAIEIGEAPEYYESFGIVRKENKLIFAKWINNLVAKIAKEAIVEFVIIRESISLFIDNKLLFEEFHQLTDLFLNIAALSFLKKRYVDKSIEPKITAITSRFLTPSESLSITDKKLLQKIDSLILIILKQGISFKLILNTYFHFIEDLKIEEINLDEIIDDIFRYLSNSPIEIVSPLILSDNSMNIIKKIVDLGYLSSTTKISKELGIDNSVVSREIQKIVSRYYARFRAERNWEKLGLHYNLGIIRFSSDQDEYKESIYQILHKNQYIGEIYEGQNAKFSYLYYNIKCPYSTIDRLALIFDRLVKENKISSFDLKTVKSRMHFTSIVDRNYKPTFENLKNLFSKNYKFQKIKLLDKEYLPYDVKFDFEQNNILLLRFLSLIISNSISNYGSIGVWLEQTKEFLQENNLRIEDLDDSIKFLNKLEKTCIENELLDFYLTLNLSGVANAEILVIQIKIDPTSDVANEIIETLTCFSWVLVHKTYNEIFISITGPNYDHQITKMILQVIESKGFDYEYFSVRSKLFRYVPYNELYDIKNKKWLNT